MPTKGIYRTQKLRILGLALFGGGLLILGLAALILLPRTDPPASLVKVGLNTPAKVDFPAPDFQLNDLEGQQVSLTDYQGKVVLVNNWATWCPPCRAEMPILEAYFHDHRNQDFILVAIDAGDPPGVVSDFVDNYGMSFPVWLDPNNTALNGFRNNYLPSSYLIDRGGKVIMAWSGAVSRASLEESITPLLKE
jgi:thiol-disulfide isomerase/thioredoxin